MKSPLFYLSSNTYQIVFIGMLLLFLSDKAEAQSTETTTLSNINLYADGGFHVAFQASLNLEKRIYSGEKVTWYGRVGGGIAGIIMAYGGAGMLGGITMLTSKSNKHFEINGGAFVLKSIEEDEDAIRVLPLLDFGYRYQKPEGGFIFRAKAGLLGVGIGVGYAF